MANVALLLETVFNGAKVGDIIKVVPSKLTVELDCTRTTLDMLLAYLDVYYSAVRELTPAYKDAKWRMEKDSILTSAAKVDSVAKWISSHCDRKKTWVYLTGLDLLPGQDDVHAAVTEDQPTREKVVGCLMRLNLQFTSSNFYSRFVIQKIPEDLTSVAESLYGRMLERETNDLKRLETMRLLITVIDFKFRKISKCFSCFYSSILGKQMLLERAVFTLWRCNRAL